MVVILMRHGEAEEPGSADERGLTGKGEDDAGSVADQLHAAGYDAEMIYHSGKKRAAQTALILAGRAGDDAVLETIAGLAPHDDVIDIAAELDRAAVPTAVVGHMPHLTNLVYHLCGNQDTPPFGTSHAVVLEQVDSAWEVQQVFRPASGC